MAAICLANGVVGRHESMPQNVAWASVSATPMRALSRSHAGTHVDGSDNTVLPHCSFFIVCLLACLICLPALIAIAFDRTVDRPVPSSVLNHHGSGVVVVGTTWLPIGCPLTEGLSSSP